jgi:hypothetical protein
VNNTPAVCLNTSDCEYEYTDPVGEVTDFAYAPQGLNMSYTRELFISGFNLPKSNDDFRNISFAKSQCLLPS